MHHRDQPRVRHDGLDHFKPQVLRSGYMMADTPVEEQILKPGDVAVVDRARSPVSGCIVLGLVGGEFTVKTYRLKAGGGVVLEAANPDFPDIVISKASAFEVWSVVTGIVRTF